MNDSSNSGFPQLRYQCPVPWSEMYGSAKERFCEKCHRTVVNLSLMTKVQREQLLTTSKDLCVAYYQAASGAPVALDFTEVLKRRDRSLKAAAALTLAASLSGLAAGCVTPKAEKAAQASVRPAQASGPAIIPIDPATGKPMEMKIGY